MSAILFTNAAVFDGVGSELRRGAEVLVADGMIQAVSERPIARPADCEVLDVAGRTLMPGLIDAHVHIWATDLDILKLITRRTEYLAAFAYRSLAAMLDRGFTTVRDAGGTDVAYVQALQDGLAPGPRLLHAGKFLSQTGGHGDFRRPGDFSLRLHRDLREGSGEGAVHPSGGQPRRGAQGGARGHCARRASDQDHGLRRCRQPLRSGGSDAVQRRRDQRRGGGGRAARGLCDGALPSGERHQAVRRVGGPLHRARHADRPGSGGSGGGEGRLRGADVWRRSGRCWTTAPSSGCRRPARRSCCRSLAGCCRGYR